MVALRLLAALLAILIVAGCSRHPPVPDPTTTPRPSSTPLASHMTSSPAARPDPTPAAEPLPVAVPAGLLPPLETDFGDVTHVCYSFPFPRDVEPLICPNMIELALRASGDLQPTVWRAEWNYDICGLSRCHDAGVAALHSLTAGTLLIDVHRDETGTVFLSPPREGPPAAPAPSFESPPVHAPSLPPGIEDRQALPYCGRFFVHDDGAVEPRCFFESMDAGQPAELVQDVVSIEGAAGVHLYRFLGTGAAQVWSWWEPDQYGGDRRWSQQMCVVYRSAHDPSAFGCDPWSDRAALPAGATCEQPPSREKDPPLARLPHRRAGLA